MSELIKLTKKQIRKLDQSGVKASKAGKQLAQYINGKKVTRFRKLINWFKWQVQAYRDSRPFIKVTYPDNSTKKFTLADWRLYGRGIIENTQSEIKPLRGSISVAYKAAYDYSINIRIDKRCVSNHDADGYKKIAEAKKDRDEAEKKLNELLKSL